jgi:hypothetical protein
MVDDEGLPTRHWLTQQAQWINQKQASNLLQLCNMNVYLHTNLHKCSDKSLYHVTFIGPRREVQVKNIAQM